MTSHMRTLLLALVLVAGTGPLLAHHSTAMYDMNTPVTVTGTVTRFEWTNPHAFIYMDVKDEKGYCFAQSVPVYFVERKLLVEWTVVNKRVSEPIDPPRDVCFTAGVVRGFVVQS